VDATEDSKDGEEALSDAKGDTNDINEKGSELVEVGESTKLGKTQIRAMQAKARVFMRAFARKAKALQHILVAKMQVRSVFIVYTYFTGVLFFTYPLLFVLHLLAFSCPKHTGPDSNFCFDHVVTESSTISS